MYSREEKLKAVELFIRYDKSPASVIREIGYPCRATLYAWHEEYLANGCDMPSVNNYRRYTEEQRRAAVDHFFEHGQCLARTIRALGYPSQELLAAWIDELEPGRRPKRSSAKRLTHENKQRAVVDLITRKGAQRTLPMNSALRERPSTIGSESFWTRRCPASCRGKETIEASRNLRNTQNP